MRKIGRGAAVALGAAVAALGVVTAFAAQGSQEDPLVTLSYLNKVVTPQLETKVEEAVKQNEQALQTKLDSAIADYEAKVNETLANAGAASQFVSKALSRDESLTLKAGKEILLVSGGAKAVGPLADTTAGKSVSAGGSLTAGHLYVTLSDGSGIKTTGAVSAMYR